MTEDLQYILLLAHRELRDQLRDWRIVLPLAILTGIFPFLMKEVAAQAVLFFARFGTTLIAYRLIPFSVLIIGFFPITISLVVALESFVGEKERGTIEPLLNAPLKNWHLYCGKLIVGTMAPLIASYVSIALYLLMVAAEGLQLPPVGTLILLTTLTTAHAVLMVSAALVISVQSTSIRAANLLASFVIIPVAIMMQGESVLLFWGSDRVLWLAVLAVVIMAGLLVRLGLSHFRREYLIGREFDQLNLAWMWRTFWTALHGGQRTARAWYQTQVRTALRQLLIPLGIVAAIAAVGFWTSYDWTTANASHFVSADGRAELTEMMEDARGRVGAIGISGELSAPGIFGNNVRVTILVFVGGLVSFSVLGLAAFLLNIGLIGGVLGLLSIIGYSPGLVLAAGVLPHGIFELPALMLTSAVTLRTGTVLVTPQTGKSMGQILLELLADGAKIILGVVIPLLLVASVIEAYATPRIWHAALP